MQRSAWTRASCPLPCEAGEAPLALLRPGHLHIHVRQARGGGASSSGFNRLLLTTQEVPAGERVPLRACGPRR